VLDHLTRRQVARYRSRIPVHELPLLLYMVGLYFNTAWLAPEVNGPGQGVIDVLKADYGYPLLYRRHRSGDDERQDSREFLVGWLTTSPSKYLMEQTFGTALKEGWHGAGRGDGAGGFDVRAGPEAPGEARGAEGRSRRSVDGLHGRASCGCGVAASPGEEGPQAGSLVSAG
jgi:hypothetical protein